MTKDDILEASSALDALRPRDANMNDTERTARFVASVPGKPGLCAVVAEAVKGALAHDAAYNPTLHTYATRYGKSAITKILGPLSDDELEALAAVIVDEQTRREP